MYALFTANANVIGGQGANRRRKSNVVDNDKRPNDDDGGGGGEGASRVSRLGRDQICTVSVSSIKSLWHPAEERRRFTDLATVFKEQADPIGAAEDLIKDSSP